MTIDTGADARRTAAETFHGLYWDTALAFGDPVLRMLRSVVGLEQVVCGTDYPYFRRDLAVGCIAALKRTGELATSEREAVMGANALTLPPSRRLIGVLRGIILARHPRPDIRGTMAKDNTS